jgi:hypothetical protein
MPGLMEKRKTMRKVSEISFKTYKKVAIVFFVIQAICLIGWLYQYGVMLKVYLATGKTLFGIDPKGFLIQGTEEIFYWFIFLVITFTILLKRKDLPFLLWLRVKLVVVFIFAIIPTFYNLLYLF